MYKMVDESGGGWVACLPMAACGAAPTRGGIPGRRPPSVHERQADSPRAPAPPQGPPRGH